MPLLWLFGQHCGGASATPPHSDTMKQTLQSTLQLFTFTTTISIFTLITLTFIDAPILLISPTFALTILLLYFTISTYKQLKEQ